MDGHSVLVPPRYFSKLEVKQGNAGDCTVLMYGNSLVLFITFLVCINN